ncbi:hypothetical protein FT663_04337 [Candidozyma haemuli var. vulneris]|uniref:Uncharacterized protein n=1 Tax=Candidozyma haemuli TaxID=45357 RepID=A0A2V1AWQ4_9ASCO|nr:hypothetical protein CXQ85_004896 [[Candida] haemuloni]KAF3986630.1 hypothetical protein FT662_04455 [[Candida] haemuloni var. vulneris]KAF3987716.1 hypothetical protein FT663_04337 [[Candida] haemuloni var. vulneris]PVH22224.1 hypothetical protein CXQ85_004896 [[Candida] haemuloni]
MSYLYIKRFVEEQVEILSQPLVIDDDVRRVMAKHNLPEETVKNALFKVNLSLKRHNKHKFSKQVVHQLVQQITKNEHDKLMKVNEQLQKVTQLVQPIIVPEAKGGLTVSERVTRLQELADVLPEPAYLFALDGGEDEEAEKEKVEEKEEDNEDGLIVDDQDRVERISKKQLEEEYIQAIREEVKEDVTLQKATNEELRQRYAALREQLVEISQKLIYDQQKLGYLEALEKKVEALKGSGMEASEASEASEGGRDDLEAQITRFRILVEKLEYATT